MNNYVHYLHENCLVTIELIISILSKYRLESERKGLHYIMLKPQRLDFTVDGSKSKKRRRDRSRSVEKTDKRFRKRRRRLPIFQFWGRDPGFSGEKSN